MSPSFKQISYVTYGLKATDSPKEIEWAYFAYNLKFRHMIRMHTYPFICDIFISICTSIQFLNTDEHDNISKQVLLISTDKVSGFCTITEHKQLQ